MTGEESALERLVRRHQAGLWRYLRALGADPQAADEIAQEVFLVAWHRQAAGLDDPAASAFLRRTARFLWLRRRRDESRRSLREAAAVEELWTRQCAADAGEGYLAHLRACLEELQERTRSALTLFYGDGLERVAVARELGMKESGVKTLLQRARAALRECIERRRS